MISQVLVTLNYSKYVGVIFNLGLLQVVGDSTDFLSHLKIYTFQKSNAKKPSSEALISRAYLFIGCIARLTRRRRAGS